jgi:hypothetical protein
MSSYRFLQDAYVGDRYYEAGTIGSTDDSGGTLPTGWVPNGNIEPLDAAAVDAFYAAGVQPLGLVRPYFTDDGVRSPVTYWQQVSGTSPPQWKLTGLGASKAPICE